MPYGPPRSLVSLAVVSMSSGRLFAGFTPALSYILRLYAVEFSSKPHGMHHCLASADPSAAPGTPFRAVDALKPGCTSSQSYFGLVLAGSLIHALRSSTQPAGPGVQAVYAAGIEGSYWLHA